MSSPSHLIKGRGTQRAGRTSISSRRLLNAENKKCVCDIRFYLGFGCNFLQKLTASKLVNTLQVSVLKIKTSGFLHCVEKWHKRIMILALSSATSGFLLASGSVSNFCAKKNSKLRNFLATRKICSGQS